MPTNPRVLRLEIGRDDGPQPILGTLVAAVGVRMVEFHQLLIGDLDLGRRRMAVEAERLEGAAIRLVQRLGALLLRRLSLLPAIAGKNVQRVGKTLLLGSRMRPLGMRGPALPGFAPKPQLGRPSVSIERLTLAAISSALMPSKKL